MKTGVPELLLARFSDFLIEQVGLDFRKEKFKLLERGIIAASREFRFDNPSDCIQWLMSADLTKEQIETLGGYLTVGETFFFREPKSFQLFEQVIIPDVIARKKGETTPARIWSAACSSGEEPYSIAMSIDSGFMGGEGVSYSVTATDINRIALKKAAEGVYSEWSFRGMPVWLRKRYFRPLEKNRFAIAPEIRRMVSLHYLNLVDERYLVSGVALSGMDVVFCRNVLMYFSAEVARRVVERITDLLVMGGWLVVSPTDAFSLTDVPYLQLESSDAPIYRKMPEKHKGSAFRLKKAVTFPDTSIQEVTPEWISAELKAPTLSEFSPSETTEPPVTELLFEKGKELYKAGLYGEVIALLTPSEASDDSLVFLGRYELLARCYANQGQLGEAEVWCAKAVDADRLNPVYRYLMATIYLEQGRPRDAVASLKQCLYIDSEFLPAHFSLGNILLQNQDYQGAHRYFDNALALLANREDNQPVMEMEQGLTAGRIKEIILVLKQKESLK